MHGDSPSVAYIRAFANTEKSRSADLVVFAGLVLGLEAVPGATEWQVPIKPFIKYKKCFSFSFLGSLELIQTLWHYRFPSQWISECKKVDISGWGKPDAR